MIKVAINYHLNLLAESLLEQRLIPCTYKVEEDKMLLEFSGPLPQLEIDAFEFTESVLDEVVSPYVGGKYSYLGHAVVSFGKNDNGEHFLDEMSVFSEFSGWHKLRLDKK